MNKTAKIILSALAVTGIVAASVFAVINSEMLRKIANDLKEHMKNNIDPNEKFKLIAKALDRDIKNTERNTSERYHEKNQHKYDKMNWDGEPVHRKDVSHN